jgi:hypothetical protein
MISIKRSAVIILHPSYDFDVSNSLARHLCMRKVGCANPFEISFTLPAFYSLGLD